jgi:hypothetical protein
VDQLHLRGLSDINAIVFTQLLEKMRKIHYTNIMLVLGLVNGILLFVTSVERTFSKYILIETYLRSAMFRMRFSDHTTILMKNKGAKKCNLSLLMKSFDPIS